MFTADILLDGPHQTKAFTDFIVDTGFGNTIDVQLIGFGTGGFCFGRFCF
jgi:hypothetical protein